MLKRTSVNGTDLEYELRGTGRGTRRPHPLGRGPRHGPNRSWTSPPWPAATGCSATTGPASPAAPGWPGPPTIAAHAAHCHQLMRELGITRAHIVGHSSSVPVALQLALDAPEAVHTLTLMEAARPAPPTDTERQFGTDVALAAAPALPRGRQGRSGRHLLPRRLRTRLPSRARPRAARSLRAGSRRRRRVLHPRNTRPPAMAVHRRRRPPHPAASARRPGNSQPPDIRRTAKAAAAMAAQRRATRPARPHPSPARAEPRRRRRRTRRLLRPPPDTRATLTAPWQERRTSCYVPRLLSRARTRDQYRRVGARSPRTSRSLTVMRFVLGRYPAGGERSRPALNGKAHAPAACCSLFRAVRDARDLAKQLRRIPVMSDAGRSKLRPANETSGPRNASPPAPPIGVFPGQRGGGCEIRTREGLPPTRFPTMLTSVHRRPPPSVACANTSRVTAGERCRTGMNETKTEPRPASAASRRGRLAGRI